MHTTIYTKYKGRPMIIEIRCDDICKNGHDTFSITGTILRKNKCHRTYYDAVYYAPTDNYYAFDTGGCIHKEILEARPDLKPFIDLYLANGDGVPLHAVENGYYHMRNMETFKRYLRLTDEQVKDFYNIKETSNQTHKGIFIDKIEAMKPIWLKEANEAKKLLKKLMEVTK